MNLRENPHMTNIMSKMFDFVLEISVIEKELLLAKEQMELIFNFNDLSFQLLDGPVDDNVALLIRKLAELRKYFDQRSTLNMHPSECIFRPVQILR